ncbi:ABC transporter ATP-binding protein [Pedobacter sp. Leaf176]|uniref:ABC transporter ATP-binding protein n=1 Tax=Pedobacter sp. Leaf176 TaxID=1736286 RepID=UPI0006FEB8AF|nr:ATP-binding cassette domain-containing protein [Pedobacter sp. Leaf176]KQR67358.1 glycine/betaine ABC transporter ATP-binding protein [Pedobacter sp. Leaf176]
MIELIGVSKKYGATIAVNQVSFKVNEGENLVLLGTSGCGKTTTLKMINRLIEPDGGQVLIDGKDIKQQNPEKLRRGIGYVMQNIGLFPHYTIEENISVIPKLLNWEKDKTDRRIIELVDKLHLPKDSLKLYPNELSGGQQQRVGLARALVADPSLLLMDEPFGALDNVTRGSIRKEFKDLEELKRKTIVMVTHDVQEAFELADRICLMDKGEIMQVGTPKELLLNPLNDFSRKFLDGERLALEFKMIRISDVWANLHEASYVSENRFSPELSVWDAMEKLRSGNLSELIFEDEKGVFKKISFDILMRAFNQYKNTNQHG